MLKRVMLMRLGFFLAFVQKMCWSVKVNMNDSSRNNNTNELFFRDIAHLSEAL